MGVEVDGMGAYVDGCVGVCGRVYVDGYAGSDKVRCGLGAESRVGG